MLKNTKKMDASAGFFYYLGGDKTHNIDTSS